MAQLGFVKHNFGQRFPYNEVNALGELARMNADALAKRVLLDGATCDLLTGEGGRFNLAGCANMEFNITGPALWLDRISADEILQVYLPSTIKVTQAVPNATGNPRYDLVEGRWTWVDKDQRTVSKIDPSTAVISSISYYTRKEVELEVKVIAGTVPSTCPDLEAGTAAVYTSTLDISGGVDTSSYTAPLLRIQIDQYPPLDVPITVGAAVTPATIVTDINTVFFAAYAINPASVVTGQFIRLTSPTTGYNSFVELTPPSAEDVIDIVLGEIIRWDYRYSYRGNADWFKIGELHVPNGTVTLTTAMLLDIDQKTAWEREASTIETLFSMYEMQNYIRSLNTADILIVRQSGGSIPEVTWEHWFGTVADHTGPFPHTTGGGWTVDANGVHVPPDLKIILGERTDGAAPNPRIGNSSPYTPNGPICFDGDCRNVLIQGMSEKHVGIELADNALNFLIGVADPSGNATTGANSTTVTTAAPCTVTPGDYVILNKVDYRNTDTTVYRVLAQTGANTFAVDRPVGSGGAAAWYTPAQQIAFEGFTWIVGTTTIGATVINVTGGAGVRFDTPFVNGSSTDDFYLFGATSRAVNRDFYFKEVGQFFDGVCAFQNLCWSEVGLIDGVWCGIGSAINRIALNCSYSIFRQVRNTRNAIVFALCEHLEVEMVENVYDNSVFLTCDYCTIGVLRDWNDGVVSTSPLSGCTHMNIEEITNCDTIGNGGAMGSCTDCRVGRITDCNATNGGALNLSDRIVVGIIRDCTATNGGAVYDCDECTVDQIIDCTALAGAGGAISLGSQVATKLIKGCTATTNGGAINGCSGGSHDLIFSCSAASGGALYGCNFMSVDIIRQCSATVTTGGAVEGGTRIKVRLIDTCTATTDGGGVDQTTFGTFDHIYNCSALGVAGVGGGAYLSTDCHFGIIHGCTAWAGGGAEACDRSQFGWLVSCSSTAVGGPTGAGVGNSAEIVITHGARGCSAGGANPAATGGAVYNCNDSTFYGTYHTNTNGAGAPPDNIVSSIGYGSFAYGVAGPTTVYNAPVHGAALAAINI